MLGLLERVSASFDERLLLTLSFALMSRVLILLREISTKTYGQQSHILETSMRHDAVLSWLARADDRNPTGGSSISLAISCECEGMSAQQQYASST